MIQPALDWFASRGWTPFDFQTETWRAYLAGQSGLVNAPTGLGKSLSVWMGPLLEYLNETTSVDRASRPAACAPPQNSGKLKRSSLAARNAAEPLRVLWITPMRALAADTTLSLLEPVRGLNLNWTVESRTGDTAQSLRKTQRERLPTALVTTPESLTLLLSYPDAHEKLASLRCVVIDEWHELLSTKRGVQTELALARLRAWNPRLRTWGLSATLGNLQQAMHVLVGQRPPPSLDPSMPPPSIPSSLPRLISAAHPKSIEIETLIPQDIERFPWAGHLGLRLLPQVLEAIDRPARKTSAQSENAPQHATSLLFTNTRSQAEIWFRAITHARPDWLGTIAIHHGSIDHSIRSRVEAMLKSGAARCVVCTSSLDLGVDFSPVDQVIQVGSPKGVARLMQRAGRSGHQPGALSRIVCVPAHAFELMEFAAVRDALAARRIESREPIDKPFDVLVQHLVTIATGGGFIEDQLRREVRSSYAYANLTDQEWTWAMDFVRRGGPTLEAYPQYARITDAPSQLAASDTPHAPSPTPLPWTVASRKIATLHRMSIGTITSDSMVNVKYLSGRSLGSMEESFLARLEPGDRFVFSGRILELVRIRDMTAYVQRSKKKGGLVPSWNGGRMPLSTQLSDAVRLKMEEARQGRFESAEMRSIQPLLEIQRERSRIPAPDELLVERISTRDGDHVIIMPFDGRLVHEGLAALCAYRLSKLTPISVHATATDYGFDIHTPRGSHKHFDINEQVLRAILSEDNLLDDLLACLNSTELARRRFRDVARVAGLILQGYPGQRKPTRHLQASSEMFFDVFLEFDPDNLLLFQARREVLEDQLEVRRLRHTLQRIANLNIVVVDTPSLTPLAFPIWAEVFRGVHASSETWSQRVARMSAELEAEAVQSETSRANRARAQDRISTDPAPQPSRTKPKRTANAKRAKRATG